MNRREWCEPMDDLTGKYSRWENLHQNCWGLLGKMKEPFCTLYNQPTHKHCFSLSLCKVFLIYWYMFFCAFDHSENLLDFCYDVSCWDKMSPRLPSPPCSGHYFWCLQALTCAKRFTKHFHTYPLIWLLCYNFGKRVQRIWLVQDNKLWIWDSLTGSWCSSHCPFNHLVFSVCLIIWLFYRVFYENRLLPYGLHPCYAFLWQKSKKQVQSKEVFGEK